MNERERIGRRIAELRKARGFSQAKLSELCGLGSGHIARIELGRYNVGITTLEKIGTALDCTIDFIEKNSTD